MQTCRRVVDCDVEVGDVGVSHDIEKDVVRLDITIMGGSDFR